MALVTSLTFNLRRHALRSSVAAVVRVAVGPGEVVHLERRDGRHLQGRLLPSSFVSPALVILNLAVGRWRLPLAVLVPADAVPRNEHRRLRVWLRWHRAEPTDHPASHGGSGEAEIPTQATELIGGGFVSGVTARLRFRKGLPGSILRRFARASFARFLLTSKPYSPHTWMSDREIDQQLVERAQRGDKRAFELLVAKYQRKLARLLSRFVRDPAEVEDVAQEAFIKAYRALPSFRGESAFYTWLYRIGINTAKNYLVAMGRRAPTTTEFDSEDAENFDDGDQLRDLNTPENELMSKQIAKTVNDTMEALPEELRTAIALREIDGLSYEEIATVMNCPIGTVRSRIFRARESIAERLRPLLETSKDKRW
jgi:RNA polymerase sigma-70 factor (ECF subfamily)